MIIKLSFVLIGGANLALEKKWGIIEHIIKNYPQATWRKIVNWKKGVVKYIIDLKE
ncbi:MAG: hypothetical protein QXW97_00310 [Candidatus Pacearchaeota archaeon]